MAQYVVLVIEGQTVKKLIRVKLKDGSTCCMAKKAFYIFLAQNKVIAFERSDGWVVADDVPTRDLSREALYDGPERRCA